VDDACLFFNWLQNDVAGSRCLDAFAGSGALGYEAASRYARSVTLVERDAAAAAALERSRLLLAADSVQVLQQSLTDFIDTRPEPFDVVFVDPPFEQSDYSAILSGLHAVLKSDSLVYVECPKRMQERFIGVPSEWETIRDKSFGEVRAQLFRMNPPA